MQLNSNSTNFPARNNVYRPPFPPSPAPPPPLSVLHGKEYTHNVNNDDIARQYQIARCRPSHERGQCTNSETTHTIMHILDGNHSVLSIFGMVNEVPFKILIDTGAGMTVVNSQFCDKLNAKQSLELQPGKYITANTANGQSISIRGSRTLHFQLGDTVYPFIAPFHARP